MADNQKLDATQVLNLKHRKFAQSMKGFALSKPSEYFQLKQEVQEKFENAMVTAIYEAFYGLLKNGTINGAPIEVTPPNYTTSIKLPCAPELAVQRINAIALSVCSSLSGEIETAINIILPDDFSKLASENLSTITKGSTIN